MSSASNLQNNPNYPNHPQGQDCHASDVPKTQQNQRDDTDHDASLEHEPLETQTSSTQDEGLYDDAEYDDTEYDDELDDEEVLAFDDEAATVAHSGAQGDALEVSELHTVTQEQAGQRIDKLAADMFTEHSRAQLQDWLKSGNLTVNDHNEKAKYRVKIGDIVRLEAKLEQHGSDQPEDIKLDIIYEDDSVIVINKPVGMVVHPGAGNWSGTLVNGLLYHYPNQAHLPRAGLVHRIDKNTSGLLVIGKTKAAQLELQEQLKDKSVYRHYQCVVAGDAPSLARQRTINAPIGRHRTQRTKMTVTSTGKTAITHIMKITPLSDTYSLLDVRLETGRTHQIRVHLSHIGHPIIGDDIYGNRQQLRAGLTPEQRQAIQSFPRQALHAYKLGFIHPETGESIELTAPLPQDIVELAHTLSDGSFTI